MSREEQRRQQQQEAIARYKRDQQKKQTRDKAQPPAYKLGQRDPQTGNYIATAPNGGTRKATPLFNSGQSQDGTLKTSYGAGGRILLDAKNRKPQRRRLVQEENPQPAGAILRWVDVIVVGPYTNNGFTASRWDLYICGGPEGRRKVGEVQGPIGYSNSFPDYLYMTNLYSLNPKVASCFYLNLTGPGDDGWEIYYVEAVWISGNEISAADLVYDINFVRVTPSGSEVLHTYNVNTAAQDGAGYTEAYYGNGTASYIRYPTISSRPYQILRYFPKSNVFNTDGYFTTDPLNLPSFGNLTITRQSKTNPLPNTYQEYQIVVTQTGSSRQWTGGANYYWFTNNDSVNTNETLAFVSGNTFPNLSFSPDTIFSFKPDGSFSSRLTSDFYVQFPEYLNTGRGFNYQPFDFVNVLPNHIAITQLKFDEGFPYSATLEPVERTANITILDGNLNGVEAIDITFTAPPDPFTEFDFNTTQTYWWNYSLVPGLWIPDYSE